MSKNSAFNRHNSFKEEDTDTANKLYQEYMKELYQEKRREENEKEREKRTADNLARFKSTLEYQKENPSLSEERRNRAARVLNAIQIEQNPKVSKKDISTRDQTVSARFKRKRPDKMRPSPEDSKWIREQLFGANARSLMPKKSEEIDTRRHGVRLTQKIVGSLKEMDQPSETQLPPEIRGSRKSRTP